jgi:non-heme chloroperoxidase
MTNHPESVTHVTRRELLIGSACMVAAAAMPRLASAQHPTLSSSNSREGANTMSTVTTKDGTEIYYKDWGKGQPIVFSHGWPLSADDWDAQMLFFLSQGYRVIAHDRRGHGRSTQVADGHDMDHYADDLAAVTTHLDLKNAIHVGQEAAKSCITSRGMVKAACPKRQSSARCPR